MAQTSIGFNGSISAVLWAQNAALLLSNTYGLGSATDLAVTQVAGSRAVSVAAGRVGGDGIVTTLSSAEQVALPAPTNGQWFLLVLNRVWSSGATSLTLRNGATTATAASGLPPAYPASLATNPGVNSDIPIAWLWGNSASTAVLIIPIVRPSTAIVPRRGTAAQRTALFGTPTDIAAQAFLQSSGGEWFNTDTACAERYFGAYDVSVNPRGVTTAGWFTIAGKVPRISAERSTNGTWGGGSAGSNAAVTWNGTTRIDGITFDGTTVTITQAGRYRVAGACGITVGSNWAQVGIRRNNVDIRRFQGSQNPNATSNISFAHEVDCAVGDTLQVVTRAQATGLALVAVDNNGPVSFLDLSYVGPA